MLHELLCDGKCITNSYAIYEWVVHMGHNLFICDISNSFKSDIWIHHEKKKTQSCHIRSRDMIHVNKCVTNSHLSITTSTLSHSHALQDPFRWMSHKLISDTYECTTDLKTEQHNLDDAIFTFATWPILMNESHIHTWHMTCDKWMRHELKIRATQLSYLQMTWPILMNESQIHIWHMNLPRTQTQSNTTLMTSHSCLWHDPLRWLSHELISDIRIRHELISELHNLDNATSTFVIWLISINGSQTDICPINLPRTQTQSNTTSMMSRLYVVAFSMNFVLVFISIITTALNSIQPEDKLSQDRLQKVFFFFSTQFGFGWGGVLLSTISAISFCICLLWDGYN